MGILHRETPAVKPESLQSAQKQHRDAVGRSALAILETAPQLAESEWKAFKVDVIAKTPKKRRPLIHYLLFKARGKPVCWPSDAAIAEDLGICKRTVNFWFDELEEHEIVLRVRVATRFRRAIFFPDHPEGKKLIAEIKRQARKQLGAAITTLVKQERKNNASESAIFAPRERNSCAAESAKIAHESLKGKREKRSSSAVSQPASQTGCLPSREEIHAALFGAKERARLEMEASDES